VRVAAEVRILPDDARVSVVTGVVLRPPARFVERARHRELARLVLLRALDAVERSVEDRMSDLDGLEVLVQAERDHAERPRDRLRAEVDQRAARDLEPLREATEVVDVARVLVADLRGDALLGGVDLFAEAFVPLEVRKRSWIDLLGDDGVRIVETKRLVALLDRDRVQNGKVVPALPRKRLLLGLRGSGDRLPLFAHGLHTLTCEVKVPQRSAHELAHFGKGSDHDVTAGAQAQRRGPSPLRPAQRPQQKPSPSPRRRLPPTAAWRAS
jgi:hypothetical protein